MAGEFLSSPCMAIPQSAQKWSGRAERATRKNSQPAAAQRVSAFLLLLNASNLLGIARSGLSRASGVC
jgi:hypothetical protein